MQYTVQPGDTLSGIGQKHGVDYKQITGYASGNPNIIRPGEVLNIPDKTGAPTTTPAPVTTAPNQNVPAPSNISVQSSQPATTYNAPSGGGNSTPFDTAKNEGTWNGVLYRDHNEYLKAQQASGGAGLPNSPQNQQIDLQKLYDQANNTPEIQAANTKIKEITDRLTAQRKAVADQESLIADNPRYSASTMTGKISKLRDKAARDEQNIINELNLAQSSLATLQGDAKVKVDIATKQYDINRQDYQDNLARFNMLVSSGALTGSNGADLASIGSSIGLSPSMIQGIIEKQKKDAIKPKVITSTDNNGNVTLVAVDEATGNIISKQSLGVIDQTKGTPGDSPYSKLSDKYLNDALSILSEADTESQKQAAGSNKYALAQVKPDKLISKAEFDSAYARIQALVGNSNEAAKIMDRAWSTGGYQRWKW